MTFPVHNTYTTVNGARDDSTSVAETGLTIPAAVDGYCYLELEERPDTTKTITIENTDATETYNVVENVPANEYDVQIDARLGKAIFTSANAGDTVNATYFGFGTIVRNEHINNIRTDIKKLQSRAAVALNHLIYFHSASAVDFNPGSDSVSIGAGTVYMPPGFDTDDINSGTNVESFYLSAKDLTVTSGDMVYAEIPSTNNSAVNPQTCTVSAFAELTNFAVLIGYRIRSKFVMWNGKEIIGPGTYSTHFFENVNSEYSHLKCNDDAASTSITDSTDRYSLSTYVNTDTINTEDMHVTGKVGTGAFDLGYSSVSGESPQINYPSNTWADIAAQGQNFTLAFWWKTSSTTGTQAICFSQSYVNHPSDKGFSAFTYDSTNSVYLRIRTDSGAYSANLSSDIINWHHYAVTRIGDELRFYIDGSQSGTTQSGADIDANLYEPTNTLTIGKSSSGDNAEGHIDDFRLYNYGLSDQEISILYNSGNGTEDSFERISAPENVAVLFDTLLYGMTQGSILYVDSNGKITENNSNLSFDGTTLSANAANIANNLTVDGNTTSNGYKYDDGTTTGTGASGTISWQAPDPGDSLTYDYTLVINGGIITSITQTAV